MTFNKKIWQYKDDITEDELNRMEQGIADAHSHIADTTVHITAAERTTWNNKAEKSVATQTSDGLMSKTDKTKLDGIEAGAQKNTVNSVNNKTGAVTLSASDVGAETPEGAQEKANQAEQNAKEYTDQEIASAKAYADQQLIAAKDYTDQKLANLSNNETVQGMQKEIANLNLQLEASQRVPNGYTFGTDFLNTFGMTIDYTKTTAIGALAVGTTTIPVESVTGFSVGQEVTIYDDVNLERVTISAIDTNAKTLTVSALTKSYKDKANIARTMAVADTVNKCMKFGGWSTQTTNTVTYATVVESAYDTSGNGGRKLVRLSNGWLISIVIDQTNKIGYWYKTIDGINWTLLCQTSSISATGPFYASMVAKGTMVYTLFGATSSATANWLYSFDASTVSGTISDQPTVDTNQSSFGAVSLAINSAGTELHAAWASKNSTYPNSFNIRYAKGTINADSSVTWGSVQQVTNLNSSSPYFQNPSITIINGNPVILAYNYTGSAFQISALVYSSGTWSSKVVYNGGSYAQYSPSACVDKNGRIWVAWHSADSTDSSVYNIRVAYSDDGGITWSAMTKLTSGNSYTQVFPSITVNKHNEVFILWYGPDSLDSYYDIRMIKYSGSSWGSISIVSAGTTGHKQYPSTLYDPTLDFSTPLFIYQDSQGGKVGFYGTWTVGSTAQLLENDIRFTVKNTNEVVAWAERDELAGFTVDAQLNGQAMTKTSVSGEDQFTGTLPSVQPAEVKLTITRANVNDDVKITKILGGVA